MVMCRPLGPWPRTRLERTGRRSEASSITKSSSISALVSTPSPSSAGSAPPLPSPSMLPAALLPPALPDEAAVAGAPFRADAPRPLRPGFALRAPRAFEVRAAVAAAVLAPAADTAGDGGGAGEGSGSGACAREGREGALASSVAARFTLPSSSSPVTGASLRLWLPPRSLIVFNSVSTRHLGHLTWKRTGLLPARAEAAHPHNSARCHMWTVTDWVRAACSPIGGICTSQSSRQPSQLSCSLPPSGGMSSARRYFLSTVPAPDDSEFMARAALKGGDAASAYLASRWRSLLAGDGCVGVVCAGEADHSYMWGS